MTDAEFAVERGTHQLLRNDRLGLGDTRNGRIIGGLRRIDGRLRAKLARRQLLGALQRRLRPDRLRLETGEVALLGTVEQLHQRRARVHVGTRREHDVGDAPGDIGGDIDLMHGGEVADRDKQVRNHLGLRLDDADIGRWRLIVGEELRDHVAAEGVETDQRAYQQRQHRTDDDKPPHRPDRTRVRFFFDRLARDIGFGHNIHVMHFLQLPVVPVPATICDPNAKQLRLR